MRMEDNLDKLQKENHLLVLKGEQMSGKLLAVAEQWHNPGMAGRKRQADQAEDILDDDERLKRFARIAR